MIPRPQAAVALCLSLLALLVSIVAAQSPSHEITSFENLPARLFFLNDSPVAIYHDVIEGIVYVSQDEGKSWNVADRIPKGEAAMVIEHPFDKNYVFVLTRGLTHYRTDDKGKTWRSFEMPVRPALVSRPLSFHSDPAKYGYILYQGTACNRVGWGAVCHDETYYTKEAFSDSPKLLLSQTSRCQFAHSTADFKHEAPPDLIYCVAFESSSDTGRQDLSSSKLFSSTDFFVENNVVEDLGIGRNARGVFAFAIVSKFAVVALKDLSPSSNGEMHLYVTVDTKTWAKAQFPHANSARLRENAYTLVESTTHSLAVDVVLKDRGTVGTLFVSNSNGTFFVESLKDTNRNEMGFVDFEKLYGVEGVGIANVVANAEEVEGRGAPKLLKSLITFDDGSSWAPLKAPQYDAGGSKVQCDTDNDDCTLHLWSVTTPHNFGRIFSSPAPGFVMGVGSIGKTLLPYEDCDTFLSTNAGLTWKMVTKDAHKYEFGDSGSVIIAVNDEDGVDTISYSLDMGQNWDTYNLGVKMRARALSTVPDSTSQKFLLVGQVARRDQTDRIGRYVVVFLDFAGMRSRKCEDRDFERWYARSGASECLMGHKQWYRRRKADANCYIGDKFNDPVVHEDSCDCKDEDYECDFNFVRNGKECVPVGPEPIPAGVCVPPERTYMGSSGWRKIPGNTCIGGDKDKPVQKDCSKAQPKEGEIAHQIFTFPSQIVQHAYFREHPTILVRLHDNSIWQSSNEGYTWDQLFPDQRFLAFYHHPYSSDRAYLITDSADYYSTTDAGRSWNKWVAPAPPNTFRAQVLRFQPDDERLIWTGNVKCDGGMFDDCHATAWYTRDHGRNWGHVEDYVVNCAWAADTKLNADPTEILCESYQRKEGNQRFFQSDNPLELVEGQGYYKKKKKLFDQVVGFAKFSEFLVVAELAASGRALDLQVSLDGVHFATGMFPPRMHPETHAYTVLESSTGSLFLHMTMSEPPSPYWGTILKSNSNGTYFIVSQENVNRDERGYVDFEKMIGLDGIALVNIVANPLDAAVSGRKAIASRITHNDGSTWKPLTPPSVDSNGNRYSCESTACSLHVHGYTERKDPRATYSSPSIVGLIMAVGNVGESLAPYTDSDTFLSRDAGFTWEEVHKDAHLYEFGDSGSILVMANDEEPTDHVLFSTDEGAHWREYKFTDDKIRVSTIVTVPSDTSRRFILFGQYSSRQNEAVAVHIDFTQLTQRQCALKIEDSANDDFELWSPSEDREERCLFGRQTLYHRRLRDTNCYVGDQEKVETVIKSNCTCSAVDFECEFNYIKNSNEECVLAPGTTPLPNDESCPGGEEFWYERTAYRKISYSTCDGGSRPDRGTAHPCPGLRHHSGWFWWWVILISFGLAGLVGLYFYRRSGLARGNIRLPTDSRSGLYGSDSGFLSTLASVPWFLVGLAGIAWEYVASSAESLSNAYRSRRGYRNLPVDEDARILRFEDEE